MTSNPKSHKNKSFSKFVPQSITIRAAIIGAVITGIFTVVVALIQFKADAAKEQKPIADEEVIATLLNWGVFNIDQGNETEIFSCTSKIRLNNVGGKRTTLNMIYAEIYVNDKHITTIWENEEAGSGDNLIGDSLVYLDFPSEQPIQIEPESFVDINQSLFFEFPSGEFKHVSVNEIDNYSDDQLFWVDVRYTFLFPGLNSKPMDLIGCMGVIK
jgi:hypothetical protein